MNARTLIPALVAAAGIAALVLAARWQRELTAGLSAIVVPCASEPAAHAAALAYQREHGGALATVLGTGSMAPLIPAAAPGLDPYATPVAYAVTVAGATFADVTKASSVIYAPSWNHGGNVLHLAAERTGDGWIMTGIHNARYETWEPMTPATFRGVAARVFTWAQPPVSQL